jgi:hypothetical protein
MSDRTCSHPATATAPADTHHAQHLRGGLKCEARAAWTALGDFNEIPIHPAALLGRCFHSVVAWVAQGRAPTPEQFGAEARARFDEKASQLYGEAHPLLRAKFNAPASLPYYSLFRERAVACAMRIGGARSTHHRRTKEERERPANRVEVLSEDWFRQTDCSWDNQTTSIPRIRGSPITKREFWQSETMPAHRTRR